MRKRKRKTRKKREDEEKKVINKVIKEQTRKKIKPSNKRAQSMLPAEKSSKVDPNLLNILSLLIFYCQ